MNDHNGYQDSGFEWIGEIPNDWTLSRVGKFFTERSEKVDDVTYPPLSVTMLGIVDQLSDVAKTSDGENRKLVKKYDFVINSRSDRKGSSGIAPRNGSVSLINIVLEPHDIDPQFIQHLFKSYYFKEEFFRNGKGIHWDLWTTRWDQFKNINIPIPSHKEQRLISRYLDKKTSQIDSLINKIEKKIELLKEQRTSLINQYMTKGLDPNVEMKDSDVEWIGEIPKHWDCKRVKHISIVKRGSSPRPIDDPKYFDENGEFSWVRIADVSASGKYLDKTTEKLSTLGSSMSTKMYPGDIFLSIAGTVGKPIITNIHCCIHDGFVWFENLQINTEFLYYSFLSGTCFQGLGKIGTQLNLNTDTVGNVSIPYPSLEEQASIVSKVVSSLRKMDKLIELEESKNLRLREYRQSIISSVTTGKLKVTEDMV